MPVLVTTQELTAQKVRSLRAYRQKAAAFVADIDGLTEKVAGAAAQMQSRARNVFTVAPCFYLYHPDTQQFAVSKTAEASDQDFALCRLAAMEAGDCQWDPINDSHALKEGWVKVAYSPTVRRVGEFLNFFPSSSSIPNWPGPVQSMLTSGLVGAGLGYGAGWLGEKLFPGKWREGRLRRLLAAMGGAAGVVPGAVWGLTNMGIGKRFTDPSLLNYQPGQTVGSTRPPLDKRQPGKPGWAEFDISRFTDEGKELSAADKRKSQAIDRVAKKVQEDIEGQIKEAFGMGSFNPHVSPDINTQTLGQVLWDVGAKPETTAMTMGAVHAAGQMPGGKKPGFVTPGQMARLGVHMGAGYLSGALVGSTLGILTGMPQGAQDALKSTGAYMGIVRAVVPRLFGQ
jgi:hypothetical protein